MQKPQKNTQIRLLMTHSEYKVDLLHMLLLVDVCISNAHVDGHA